MSANKTRLRFLSFILSLLLPQTALAVNSEIEDPLWELGAVALAFGGPAYPGADDETTAWGTAPFFIYRGDVFSVGDEGALRALAFANNKLELDLSLGASLPADSKDDADRAGMEDLDALFEIGPQLIWHASKQQGEKFTRYFDIKLRARSVISTDFRNFDDRGYLFEPAFVFEWSSRQTRNLFFQIDVEMLFGSERLNEYFYDVDAPYANANRPEYQADAGYIGTEIGFGFSYPFADNLRLFVGAGVELYGGSANEDSPLFKQDVAYSGGMVLVYNFYESDAREAR